MKKTILLSAVLAAGAALATSVESGNAVGALDVSLANDKATLIAVPFVGYGDEGAVAVQDMVKTSDLADGSKLYVADGEGGYHVWELQSGSWTSVNKVTIDKKGQSTSGITPSSDAFTAKRGDSFWLEPIFKSGSAGTVFLLGQGDAAQGSSTVAAGWNLIGNTATIAKDVPAGAEGEKVCVPNEGGLVTYTYRSGWRKEGPDFRTKTYDITIQPGRGFWFLSNSEKSIAW